jgi:hypothetical protein
MFNTYNPIINQNVVSYKIKGVIHLQIMSYCIYISITICLEILNTSPFTIHVQIYIVSYHDRKFFITKTEQQTV